MNKSALRPPWLKKALKTALQEFPLPIPKNVEGDWWFSHPLQFPWKPEPHVLGWARSSLTKGNTFIDVGAHAGWISLAASRIVGLTGRVVAFEPSPALVSLLHYHLRINRRPNILVEPIAITDSCGPADFLLCNHGLSSINSLLEAATRQQAPEGASLQRITVETQTLDAYCHSKKIVPDLVKIDVEGAELLVLRGAIHLLAERKPGVIVAVHPPLLDGGSQQDLFELLHAHRYSMRESHTVRVDETLWGDYFFV